MLGVTIGQGEWIIILVVLLLLFGSTQLPKLARSLGSAQKEFRKGMKEGDAEGEDDEEGTDDSEPAPKAKGRRAAKAKN